jgi:hypothetical protein
LFGRVWRGNLILPQIRQDFPLFFVNFLPFYLWKIGGLDDGLKIRKLKPESEGDRLWKTRRKSH